MVKQMKKHKVGWKRYKSIDDRYDAYYREAELSKESIEILKEWMRERRSNNFRDVNNIGLLGTLINIAQASGIELQEVNSKKKLQDFFNKSNLKSSQELWYKKSLKRFYNWLSIYKDVPRYLINTNWINTKHLAQKCREQSSKKREDNLLTPEEVRKMISRAMLNRDKLAISLIADTGVRAETIGASRNQRSINVGQIEFKKGYAIIQDIEEKFSKRRNVIVTESLSYLIKYWNELPEDYRSNPDNPLFIQYSNNRYGQRWGYTGLKDMLHKVSKQAIGRIINPHDFRHMKATRLEADDRLSDDSKCKLMGWSSRRMLDRYSHTTFNEAKDEYLQKKGIIAVDEDKREVEQAILKPKECLVCRYINSATDVVCERCGNSLDYERMIEDFTHNREAENRFMECLKKLNKISPEAMVKFVDTISRLDDETKIEISDKK